MPVAVYVRMKRCRVKKNDLRSFHRVMLGKINLELELLALIERPRCPDNFDNPPLEIIGDLVLEAGRGIDLPFHEFLLEPIAGDLAQSLAGRG